MTAAYAKTSFVIYGIFYFTITFTNKRPQTRNNLFKNHSSDFRVYPKHAHEV